MGYELKEEELPMSSYERILREFLASQNQTVRVQMEGKPMNIYQALRMVVKRKRLNVKVLLRRGMVYLARGDLVESEEGALLF
jgi:hypothetical protein